MKLVIARISISMNAVGKEIFIFRFIGGAGGGEERNKPTNPDDIVSTISSRVLLFSPSPVFTATGRVL